MINVMLQDHVMHSSAYAAGFRAQSRQKPLRIMDERNPREPKRMEEIGRQTTQNFYRFFSLHEKRVTV